jgi:hypothetical protein
MIILFPIVREGLAGCTESTGGKNMKGGARCSKKGSKDRNSEEYSPGGPGQVLTAGRKRIASQHFYSL